VTTFPRVLVAVDDSPAALTAIDVAVSLAADSGAALRAVAVTEDGALAATLDELRPTDGAESRIAGAAHAVLGHIARLATERGVALETAQLTGEPFRAILDEARRWHADLIVMGRSDRRGPASPYVGSEVEHVLEFCQTPVLVVPQTTASERSNGE
jgi:nucleotide-binding universal stress UspA family protein